MPRIKVRKILNEVADEPVKNKTKFVSVRKQAAEAILNLNVTVAVLPLPDVRKLAVDYYNTKIRKPYGRWASLGSVDWFLERITVNFIRHCLTEYDHHTLEVQRLHLGNKTYAVLNRRVFPKIMEAYPDLEKECLRQLNLKSNN